MAPVGVGTITVAGKDVAGALNSRPGYNLDKVV
jgi:hypothetical protein